MCIRDRSYIPKQCCEGIFERGYDFEHMQLCDILKEGYGIEQNQMVETLEIVNARPDEAQLLNVDENYPLKMCIRDRPSIMKKSIQRTSKEFHSPTCAAPSFLWTGKETT